MATRTVCDISKQEFSENLSQVLEDIGINVDIVQMKRETFLLLEDLYKVSTGVSVTRFFGSQSEATTTIDLESDFDLLHYKTSFNIVQSANEVDCRRDNLLVVKDSTTAPGYCRLHVFIGFALPLVLFYTLPNFMYHTYDNGNLCFLNEVIFTDYKTVSPEIRFKKIRRGPSNILPGHQQMDEVAVLPFVSWPKESKAWLSNAIEKKWPSADMLKVIKDQTCLLVPVGHRQSDRRQYEWRISYAETERYLMFSLNIIQLQCYVMLKLIKKQYLSKKVTSYHLKMILFLTISQLTEKDWSRKSLFAFVIRCLKTLSWCLHSGNCPNFINPDVNLFKGKFSPKHRKELHQRVVIVIENGYRYIFRIELDEVGDRLRSKCAKQLEYRGLLSKDEISLHIKHTLQYALKSYKGCIVHHAFNSDDSCDILRIINLLKHGTLKEKAAAMILLPGVIGNLAAIEISKCISCGHTVNDSLISFLKFGRIFDEVSISLKLATIYYKIGRIYDAIEILNVVETGGQITKFKLHTSCWMRYAQWYGGYLTFDVKLSHCVRFLRQELSICPTGLIFEMYRSTKYDKKYRLYEIDNYMDTAEIDPLTYFFWLKFLLFSAVKNTAHARDAMLDLVETLRNWVYLSHPETVFNLIGQYFASRGNFQNAFKCYKWSLKIEPINNAAKWLLAILLYKCFRQSCFETLKKLTVVPNNFAGTRCRTKVTFQHAYSHN